MFKWIKSLWSSIRGRELKDYLYETKVVKVMGIRFVIRRMDMTDYLDGSKTLNTYFELYKSGDTRGAEQNLKKVKQHYTDCIMAAVVEPKLKRKENPEDPAIFVGEVVRDLQLATQLYTEIVAFTDGKKKAK